MSPVKVQIMVVLGRGRTVPLFPSRDQGLEDMGVVSRRGLASDL